MTLKLSFDSPVPHNQRDHVIKAFRDLGLQYERIYQSGIYSLHRFHGRLPTNQGSSDVKLNTISVNDDFVNVFHNVNYIEIFINIERE